MTEFWQLGVAQLARAIREGSVSAEAITASFVERAKAQRNLNAFTALDERAIIFAREADTRRCRGDAMGPLHGVPLALKDNIDVAGLPTTACTPALRHHRPQRDAAVAARLFAAGAGLIGKTTMHELAFGVTCNNPTFGPAHNPYDFAMIPGGSSGGTGVAVAARLCAGGIGTDTGGSVRVPAALCGIAGLRPTTGRWPRAGIVPVSATRDTPGPMARCVEDLILLDRVVTGQRPASPLGDLRGIRLGVPEEYFWENIDPDVAVLARAAVAAAKAAGATIIEAGIADVSRLCEVVSFAVVFGEAKRDLENYLAGTRPQISFDALVAHVASPDVAAALRPLLTVSPARNRAYEEAIRISRPRLIDAITTYFRENRLDAFFSPTTALPARPIGQDETVRLNAAEVPTFLTYIRNADPGSNAGIPGVTVPAGLTSAGLPVGISLDGPAGSDQRLLAIAKCLEAVLGATRPPVPFDNASD